MRERAVIDQCIERFGLDLRCMTVFTEAATGAFRWTPVLALLAGAAEVHALARSSRYGTAGEVQAATLELAGRMGIAGRLRLVDGHDSLGQADIVTNLGAVRPLDAPAIRRMKATAVIPLMWETWEYRPGDLDLAACLAAEILVLGTNEAHPRLAYQRYVGLLAMKLLFEAGVEIGGSAVLLAGGGAFAAAALECLLAAGCEVRFVCPVQQIPGRFRERWLDTDLAGPGALAFLAGAEALLVMDHHREAMLLGPGAELDAPALKRLNGGLRIVHVSGLIDADGLRAEGFPVHPPVIARAPRTMSVTPAWLGPRPVIELHAAGLKVGAVMARARRAHPGDFAAARRLALQDPLCQDFSPEQYLQAGIRTR